MLIFIDGFSIFRNSYRPLAGMYVTPAGLSIEERCCPGRISFLVLGPHSSEFSDEVKCLGSMAELEQGLVLTLDDGRTVRTCAFTMAYTDDMPQQAENSGLRHLARISSVEHVTLALTIRRVF